VSATDIASIANFADRLPASARGGAAPRVTGVVSGRSSNGDGVTPGRDGNTLRLQSSVPGSHGSTSSLYRRLRNYRLAAGSDGYSGWVTIPEAPSH